MARRMTDLRPGRDHGRGTPRGNAVPTPDAGPHKPVALVRDLPANFFAVGRMHDSESFMVIDSKEVLVRRREGSQ